MRTPAAMAVLLAAFAMGGVDSRPVEDPGEPDPDTLHPRCRAQGCYMFTPGTVEARVCGRKCRMLREERHVAVIYGEPHGGAAEALRKLAEEHDVIVISAEDAAEDLRRRNEVAELLRQREAERAAREAQRASEKAAEAKARLLAATPAKTLRRRARLGDIAARDELARRGG